MRTIKSKDGTTIAFDQSGKGPALILVNGAFGQRAMGGAFAQIAASPRVTEHFTVINYDRRGRGGSTDTQPFSVEREIEDIEALLDEFGGSGFLFGISSGGALALEATLQLPSKVRKLAIYEPPYNDDPQARQGWTIYHRQLNEALAAGRRGEAVALFMRLVGTPAEQVEGMRQHPMWSGLEGIAPTLAYDATVMGEEAAVPAERVAQITVPALVMAGGAGFPFMQTTGRALAAAIPNAQYRTLEGQTHDVSADALAPVLVEFFTS